MRKIYNFLLFSVFLAGCTSGMNQYYTGGGNQCPADNGSPDFPFQSDMSTAKKYSPANWSDLTSTDDPGDLTYDGSILYYHHASTGISVAVTDAPNKTDKTQSTTAINCVHTFRAMKTVEPKFDAMVLTGLTYSKTANNWTMSSKTIGFHFENNGVKAVSIPWKSRDLQSDDPESPFWFFAQPAVDGVKSRVSLWCVGSCGPNDSTRHYEIRASSNNPTDKRQLLSLYTWTKAKTDSK